MSTSLLYPRETVSRRVASLDGFWNFKFDPKSVGEKDGWTKGLKDAISMPVPASFNDILTDKDSREYCGDFWYEKDVFVPGEWEGKDIIVRFGNGSQKATVFMNGVKICEHLGGYLPFNALVTDVVKYNAYNKLSVLLNNELSEENIPVGKTQVLANGKKVNAPYFDFFSYAGLQRPVKLLALPKERVLDYETKYTIDGKNATVSYKVETNGKSKVLVELLDKNGKKVACGEGKSGKLEVKNAKLWNVWNTGKPYLYTIKITLASGDEYFDTIGIRTFVVKGDTFLLNGKPIYLKGFGRHEDSNIRGKGLDLALNKRDYELMKWIGSNSYRTSHYPYAEEMYYEADEEGFLIIDEVPSVGLMESTMNFLAANQGNGKQVGFFEKETTYGNLLKNHKEQVREYITRDKNHPSVVAWSLLNEPQCTSPNSEPYFKEIFELAHKLDPQKRPRTYANVMTSTPDKCTCHKFCDFVSLNRYYGWYVLGGAPIITAEAMFRKEMDAWSKLLKGRPLIFTEYGADTLGSEHKLPSVMWSQEYQREYLDMNHKVFDSYKFVKGEQVWNFADFQTTEGIMRVNGNKKGIFTRDRQPKDAAYTFKARWEKLPNNYKAK